MTEVLRVHEPGLFTTIQDTGRLHAIASGVPPGGAMDRFAHSAANLIVGNVVTATINGPVTQGNGATWSLGSGAILNLGGGGFNASGNFVWKGGGTVNLTAGNYTPGVL